MGGAKEKAGSAASTSVPRNETINIFSVASGHLYERFLRCVCVCVCVCGVCMWCVCSVCGVCVVCVCVWFIVVRV